MPGNGHINALVFSAHILTYARVICVTHTSWALVQRPVPQNLPDGNSRSVGCPCCRTVRIVCVSGTFGWGASHIPHTSPHVVCTYALKVAELKCFGACSHPRPSMAGILTGVSSPCLCQHVSQTDSVRSHFQFLHPLLCGCVRIDVRKLSHDFLQRQCPWTSAVNVVKIRL